MAYVLKRGLSNYLIGQRKDGWMRWTTKQSLAKRFDSAESARLFVEERLGTFSTLDNLRPVRVKARAAK